MPFKSILRASKNVILMNECINRIPSRNPVFQSRGTCEMEKEEFVNSSWLQMKLHHNGVDIFAGPMQSGGFISSFRCKGVARVDARLFGDKYTPEEQT